MCGYQGVVCVSLGRLCVWLSGKECVWLLGGCVCSYQGVVCGYQRGCVCVCVWLSEAVGLLSQMQLSEIRGLQPAPVPS